MFAGKTTATWQKTADGLTLNYTSDKEQNNLHAKGNVKSGEFEVSVDKAGAQESAVVAALQAQAAMAQMLQQLLQQVMPLITDAAKAGALAGGS